MPRNRRIHFSWYFSWDVDRRSAFPNDVKNQITQMMSLREFVPDREMDPADGFLSQDLPDWASGHRSRRRMVAATAIILLLIWATTISSVDLGVFHYLGMAIAILFPLSALNFSLRSVFDVPDSVHDERTLALRDSYSFLSYKVVGLLVLALLAAVMFGVDASRLWLPAIASYAAIPYILLGWASTDVD